MVNDSASNFVGKCAVEDCEGDVGELTTVVQKDPVSHLSPTPSRPLPPSSRSVPALLHGEAKASGSGLGLSIWGGSGRSVRLLGVGGVRTCGSKERWGPHRR